MVSIKKG